MNKSHIRALAELEAACFSSPWSENAFAEELDNRFAVFIVAVDGDAVIGYVGSHFVCGEGAMTNLAVHPEHRRKGVGSALLAALADEGKKRSADAIYLEVRRSNSAAISLYSKAGYVVCGERPDFYAKPVEDAVLMTLKLQ